VNARRNIALDERDVVLYTISDPKALHSAVNSLYERAKVRVKSAPDRVDPDTGEVTPRTWRFTFGEAEDDRSLKQLRFYWGVLLRQISEQAVMNGVRYNAEGWHEAFKRQVLGFEIVKVRVAGRKHSQAYRRLKSTTRLTVKQMSEYLDEIIAIASTDLGVVFEFDQQERDSVRYRAPAKAKPTEHTAA
jgi:hypothetical protein